MKQYVKKRFYFYPKIKEVTLKDIKLPAMAQPKWDGETCFLFWDSIQGRWCTCNNHGHYRTEYPITDEAGKLGLDMSYTYIGEQCSGSNLYDFLRVRTHNPEKLFLRVFDIEEKGLSFITRHNILQAMFPYVQDSLKQYLGDDKDMADFVTTVSSVVNTIDIVPAYAATSITQLRHIFKVITEERGFEGIVCRDPWKTTLHPWIYKVKKQRTVDVAILGIAKTGKHYAANKGISTLLTGLYHKGKFLKVGRVGTGISEKERKSLLSSLLRLKTDEDKHYVYVQPKKVIEIVFNDLITTKNKTFQVNKTFRGARINRLRPDKEPEDCKLLHQLYEAKPIP